MWNVEMTRRHPLPHALRNAPFHIAEARESGVPRSRLRASDLIVPTRGVRWARPAELTAPDAVLSPTLRMERLAQWLHEDVACFAPALSPHQFFSHETGLALLGVPLPWTNAPRRTVHISSRRPHPMPRRSGVQGHRLQQRENALMRVGSLPIESPARMWRQAATLWSIDDLIVAGDFLVHPQRGLLTIDDLRSEVAKAGDVRGRLTAALDEIRLGSESPEETRLRLLLTRAGLPEPEVNVEIIDSRGTFVARLDLAYPEYRVAPEYDGRVHAAEGQFAKDADRWEAIRAAGWRHVRILSHHVRPNPQLAIDKVAQALFEAGWRPGRR